MRYKTRIEITTEAADKNEAIEIVGEYLSGNVVSGIDMRCTTKPVNSQQKTIISVAVVSLLLLVGIAVSNYTRPSSNFSVSVPGVDAVQPPLKSSANDKVDAKFKKQWEAKHTRAALDSAKNAK